MCGRAFSPLKYTTSLTPKAGDLSKDKRPVLALPNYISSGNCNQYTTSSCDDFYVDVSFSCELKSYDVFFFFRKAYLLAFNV